MESNVLSNIPGIEYYPIFSLGLFFLFFAGLILWFFRADKNVLATIAQQPLDQPPPNLPLRKGEGWKTEDIHHQN